MQIGYDLKKLYTEALTPQPGEKVTFINDFPKEEGNVTPGHRHRAEMTVLWHEVMKELADEAGFNIAPILTIDLRNPAPGNFSGDGYMDKKPVNLKEIMDSWGEKDIIIAITGPSITGELVRRLPQNFRFASAPNVTIDFEGFRADYSKIPIRFEILTGKMGMADSVEMTFRYNKNQWKCTFDIRGQRYQFRENGSARRPGEFINLPSGCANIPPYPGIEGDIRGKSRIHYSLFTTS